MVPAVDFQGTKGTRYSSGLHSGPVDQRDQPETQEEEGPGLLAVLDAVSFFSLHSSRLRNVPKLGGREPRPLEVALTLQLLQEPGGSGQN